VRLTTTELARTKVDRGRDRSGLDADQAAGSPSTAVLPDARAAADVGTLPPSAPVLTGFREKASAAVADGSEVLRGDRTERSETGFEYVSASSPRETASIGPVAAPEAAAGGEEEGLTIMREEPGKRREDCSRRCACGDDTSLQLLT
jgi:hypothetical protein